MVGCFFNRQKGRRKTQRKNKTFDSVSTVFDKDKMILLSYLGLQRHQTSSHQKSCNNFWHICRIECFLSKKNPLSTLKSLRQFKI